MLPEDQFARWGGGGGRDVKLCFCRRARSAVSSPSFCPSFSANVGVFHSWLEARGADLPCAVVGYSKRQRVIKSEKTMKGKEEEAGVAGQWLFTSARQRVFEEISWQRV